MRGEGRDVGDEDEQEVPEGRPADVSAGAEPWSATHRAPGNQPRSSSSPLARRPQDQAPTRSRAQVRDVHDRAGGHDLSGRPARTSRVRPSSRSPWRASRTIRAGGRSKGTVYRNKRAESNGDGSLRAGPSRSYRIVPRHGRDPKHYARGARRTSVGACGRGACTRRRSVSVEIQDRRLGCFIVELQRCDWFAYVAGAASPPLSAPDPSEPPPFAPLPQYECPVVPDCQEQIGVTLGGLPCDPVGYLRRVGPAGPNSATRGCGGCGRGSSDCRADGDRGRPRRGRGPRTRSASDRRMAASPGLSS